MHHVLKTALAFVFIANTAMAAEVDVKIEGLKSDKGQVLLALQSKDDFMSERWSASAMASAADVLAGPVTIEGVEPGTYALSAFHDANSDFQMQRDPWGVPLEGWAMINGESLQGIPTFEAVAFEKGEDDATLNVTMIYEEDRAGE